MDGDLPNFHKQGYTIIELIITIILIGVLIQTGMILYGNLSNLITNSRKKGSDIGRLLMVTEIYDKLTLLSDSISIKENNSIFFNNKKKLFTWDANKNEIIENNQQRLAKFYSLKQISISFDTTNNPFFGQLIRIQYDFNNNHGPTIQYIYNQNILKR